MHYITKLTNETNYANRGMILEEDINITNKYYLDNDIAVIYKKPTPIKILKLDYKTNKITNAFFEAKSTLDYNGIYKGNYIEFDAKEVNSKTSFPLSNIHPHQLEHIKKILSHGGICFLIVRFIPINKTFLLYGQDLLNFIKDNDRKSIPLSYFIDNCSIIELKYNPRLDYIKVLKERLK